jgi:hypothetical protein
MSTPFDPHGAGGPPGGVERRRYPRVLPGDDVKIAVPVVVSAEVLDISPAGALLSTSAVIEPGERAHLRLLLDGEPFNTWVHVRRVHPGTLDGKETRHRVGVTFAALDDGSRRALQRFMKDDSTGAASRP